MDFACISEQGSRLINEDACIVKENNGNFLFTVCDGLGGHAKGDVASELTVKTFSDCFESFGGNIPDYFKSAYSESVKKLAGLSKESPDLSEMKTTAVSLVISNGKCMWSHIGDSRLYAFKNAKVVHCTGDHSVPQMLVKSGRITFRDIRSHPDRNKLLRVIGADGENAEYQASGLFDTKEFDAFLLCTDGYWELINERKIITCLNHSDNANEWLSKMTKYVKHKGKRRKNDNFTAVAVLINGGNG